MPYAKQLSVGQRFWILDFGFWILDFGFWILDFGFWILDFGLFFGSVSCPLWMRGQSKIVNLKSKIV
jgi:hypothetical protein